MPAEGIEPPYPPCHGGALPLSQASPPSCIADEGIEPSFPACDAGVLPLDQAADDPTALHASRVAESNRTCRLMRPARRHALPPASDLRPYTDSPGRTRTPNTVLEARSDSLSPREIVRALQAGRGGSARTHALPADCRPQEKRLRPESHRLSHPRQGSGSTPLPSEACVHQTADHLPSNRCAVAAHALHGAPGSRTRSSWASTRRSVLTSSSPETASRPRRDLHPRYPALQAGAFAAQPRGQSTSLARQELNLGLDVRRVVCRSATPRAIHTSMCFTSRVSDGSRTRSSSLTSSRAPGTLQTPSIGGGGVEPPPAAYQAAMQSPTTPSVHATFANIGRTGFEPAPSRSQTGRSPLSYLPNIGAAGFEPAFSCIRSRRVGRFPTLRNPSTDWPARARTSISGSKGRRLPIGRRAIMLEAGIEPAPRRWKRRVPPRHSTSAVPLHYLTAGEGFEPPSPGSEPDILPVRRSRIGAPGGARTHTWLLKKQMLCHSSSRHIRPLLWCARWGSNPHSAA